MSPFDWLCTNISAIFRLLLDAWLFVLVYLASVLLNQVLSLSPDMLFATLVCS